MRPTMVAIKARRREFSQRSPTVHRKSSLLNGLLRFPLVLSYCLLGWVWRLLLHKMLTLLHRCHLPAQAFNFNLAFPMYVMGNFAPGFVGLVMVGLLAAAMSSIDSAINSLSAATMEDFVRPNWQLDDRQVLQLSRLLTLFWGLLVSRFRFKLSASRQLYWRQ